MPVPKKEAKADKARSLPTKQTITEKLMSAIKALPPPERLGIKRGAPVGAGSAYWLAKRIRVHPNSLYRFVAGNGGLSLEVIQKLCDYFNLTLVEAAPQPKGQATVNLKVQSDDDPEGT